MGKSVYPACITYCAEVAMTVDVSQNKNNLNNIFHFPSGALNWHGIASSVIPLICGGGILSTIVNH